MSPSQRQSLLADFMVLPKRCIADAPILEIGFRRSLICRKAGSGGDANVRSRNASARRSARLKGKTATQRWPFRSVGSTGIGGGEEEDRTPDLRIANATLSQL